MALDEGTKYWTALGGGLLFLLLVAGVLWVALRAADDRADVPSPSPPKVFKRTLMEDLRVSRPGVRGVDFIRCKTCRLEKRKRGVLTFGGLNTLVIEDLEVVLPNDDAEGRTEASSSAKDVVQKIGISDGFLADRGLPYSFSGVRIAGLTLSRLLCDNTPQRLFSAKKAEATHGGLALTDCHVVFTDGERPVGKAMLTSDGGALRLKWRGGEMNLNETTKKE